MFYHTINPTLLNLGPFEIRYYGLIFVFGFIIAYFSIPYIAKIKRLKFTRNDTTDLLFYLIIGVITGSRIFYIIFYNLKYYLINPLETFTIWHGGLSFHGGLIGAIIAGYIFCKKKKINFFVLGDIVVIPLAIGLVFGRIGNFINGELVGRITSIKTICVDYSRNNFIEQVSGCRWPSQLLESLKNLIIFAILWFLKDKDLPPGFLFWLFITMYGFLRFFIEFIRMPDAQLGFIIGGLTMGQLLNIPMVLVGGLMLVRLIGKKE
jgi:phosphatidylglycerol:prolipoprotein diacylglycerol transferase